MQVKKRLKLNQSALYARRSHKKLAELLCVSIKALPQLSEDLNYRLKLVVDDGPRKKKRLVQIPVGRLRPVHDRIQRLLAQIETPDYLYSGLSGVNVVDNATEHTSYPYTLKMDIKRYFPNCSREQAEKFYRRTMMIPKDVARTLSEICTYDGSIPTGSPFSMSLAFWSYKATFDQIDRLARERNVKFTLWVDDMVFSAMEPIPRSFKADVVRLIRNAGHRINPKKTKNFLRSDFKVITGVAISPGGELLVSNRHREKILDCLARGGGIEGLGLREARSVLGMIQFGRQIEPRFFTKAYLLIKERLKRLQE